MQIYEKCETAENDSPEVFLHRHTASDANVSQDGYHSCDGKGLHTPAQAGFKPHENLSKKARKPSNIMTNFSSGIRVNLEAVLYVLQYSNIILQTLIFRREEVFSAFLRENGRKEGKRC